MATRQEYFAAVDFYSQALAAGVTEVGPTPLAKRIKAPKTKLKAAAKGGDPLDALFKEAKLGKKQKTILDASGPTIRWIANESKDDLAPGASKLGGEPDVPAGFTWPKTAAGRPLEFLASLDFDAAPKIDGVPAVSGRLLFFYDVEEMPWAIRARPAGR